MSSSVQFSFQVESMPSRQSKGICTVCLLYPALYGRIPSCFDVCVLRYLVGDYFFSNLIFQSHSKRFLYFYMININLSV